MADVLALTNLFDAVVTRFTTEATSVTQKFGWRESAKQLVTGNRIVWIPGDPSGNLGTVLPARSPGQNPRPLATLEELFTVEITASDNAHPTDERAQYVAARLVFDAWLRAVYLAARGVFRIISDQWVTAQLERRHGACIRVVCAIQAMVPDSPLTAAPIDTSALVDVEALDATESISIP